MVVGDRLTIVEVLFGSDCSCAIEEYAGLQSQCTRTGAKELVTYFHGLANF